MIVTLRRFLGSLVKELFSRLGEELLESSVTSFAEDEVDVVRARSLRVEDEGVLALFLEVRIVAVQRPVTASHSALISICACAMLMPWLMHGA